MTDNHLTDAESERDCFDSYHDCLRAMRERMVCKLYTDELLSQEQIEIRTGISRGTVRGILHRHNVPMRSAQEARDLKKGRGKTAKPYDARAATKFTDRYPPGTQFQDIRNPDFDRYRGAGISRVRAA